MNENGSYISCISLNDISKAFWNNKFCHFFTFSNQEIFIMRKLIRNWRHIPKSIFRTKSAKQLKDAQCGLCHGHCRRKESKIDFRISSFDRIKFKSKTFRVLIVYKKKLFPWSHLRSNKNSPTFLLHQFFRDYRNFYIHLAQL